jgi:hypothetical protein
MLPIFLFPLWLTMSMRRFKLQIPKYTNYKQITNYNYQNYKQLNRASIESAVIRLKLRFSFFPSFLKHSCLLFVICGLEFVCDL